MIKDNLTKLGLTANEAETYVFLLEAYKAKASEIAKHLGVTHPAAKKILDNLISKDLVRHGEYGKTTYYFPQGGENIVNFINKENKKIEQKQNKKKELAQTTSSLVEGKVALGKETKSRISFHKGIKGRDKMAEEIAASKDKLIREFIDTDILLYRNQKDNSGYIKKYKENNLNFNIIYAKNEGEIKTYFENTKVLKLNKQQTKTPAAQMLIYDDKVAFCFVSDDYSIIIIQNEWISNTLKTIHDSLINKK